MDETENRTAAAEEPPEEDDLISEEEAPARPRNRLLRPLPLMLTAVLVVAASFLVGVQVQKGGDEGESTASVPGGDDLSAMFSPGAAEAETAASGTVTRVDGSKIYLKEDDGTVVVVKAGDGATVTRNSKVSANGVHPGDSVVVEGSKNGSSVSASAISATEQSG